MDEYLGNLMSASRTGLHWLAVQGALTLPDVCGALGYPNGRASGPRYRHWWDANMPSGYADHMPGERAYAFRNSLLHQGSARHERRPHDRIVLMEPRPDGNIVHLGTHINGESVAHVIYAPFLVRDVVIAARMWLDERRSDATVNRNLERFARRHPDGLDGVIVGTAVIA